MKSIVFTRFQIFLGQAYIVEYIQYSKIYFKLSHHKLCSCLISSRWFVTIRRVACTVFIIGTMQRYRHCRMYSLLAQCNHPAFINGTMQRHVKTQVGQHVHVHVHVFITGTMQSTLNTQKCSSQLLALKKTSMTTNFSQQYLSFLMKLRL